jgi:hypothetical protein
MITPTEEKASWMKAMIKAVTNIKLYCKFNDNKADDIGHGVHYNIEQLLQYGCIYI